MHLGQLVDRQLNDAQLAASTHRLIGAFKGCSRCQLLGRQLLVYF